MPQMDLVYNEKFILHGMPMYIKWNTESAPNMAISGITGTGKTYLLKLILARISKYITNSHITLCDFKGDTDFNFLNGCERFHRFEDCKNGFNNFFDDFIQCRHDGDSRSFQLLVFDEWASYLNYLEKKEADEAKKKLSTLLMLGRSFNYHVLLSQQRLDAESFAKSRDNFNVVITLGNPSKEVKEMLFSEHKEDILGDRTRGTGYMVTNGTDFRKIIVPTISNMDLVDDSIKQALER